MPSNSKSNSLTVAKPSPMVALFRREVTTFLSTPPSPHLLNEEVKILASIERISSSNIQQSVQLCEAGGETWVTRTEGNREHFPRIGRVQNQKRVRNDETEENEDAVPEEAVGADTAVREGREREEMRGEDGELNAPTSAKKGKGGRNSNSSKNTPIAVGGASSASGSTRRPRASIPRAPRKSQTTRRHSSPGTSIPSTSSIADTFSDDAIMRQNVREALGRGGKRRCSNKEGNAEFIVKEEGDLDDLASLCGGVGGLDVQTNFYTDSE